MGHLSANGERLHDQSGFRAVYAERVHDGSRRVDRSCDRRSDGAVARAVGGAGLAGGLSGLSWRQQIRYVATTCQPPTGAVVRTALPDALVVVDHFHVVQLANKMLCLVRRRTNSQDRGRRGRATDPEWKAGRRLLRNRKDRTNEQFAWMWNPLFD
ncbi:transposase [Streptomyces sp. NPDC001153]